ncbi:MAG: acetate kinase [Flavitalea sp.]
MKIFVINAGSSSLKYQLFEMPSPQPVCSGQVEKIGGSAEIKHVIAGDKPLEIKRATSVVNHGEAMQEIIGLLTDKTIGVIDSPDDIVAVGHRVVHGGETFSEATIITEAAKEKIKQLFSLAPLHNPVNYECLVLAEKTFLKAKQIAIFDTAFHQTIPPAAYRYAIPSKYYDEQQIRVYGFHGTSHKYVTDKLAKHLGQIPSSVISIHLGNGCSMAAVKDGRSIDTTMGFGPLAGLVMGTRSGDIDPSVLLHFAEHYKMSFGQISALLNKQSGMAGFTGTNDMRDVRKLINSGDKQAIIAEQIYVYRIKRYIGAYAAAMNGLDAIIFTAGVGENDRDIRRLVCADLDFLGIELDEEKNQAAREAVCELQVAGSRVQIFMVRTNEELEIAEQCYQLMQ